MQLETRYTKEQILEAYLNTIFLGGSYYGVKVAANGYFGKELSELTLRECAMLAGLTRSPNYYNPRKNFYTRNTEDNSATAKITNDRTDYVLRMMYENQFITKEQYDAALDPSTAHVLETSPVSTDMYDYAYYVEYAITDVGRYIPGAQPAGGHVRQPLCNGKQAAHRRLQRVPVYRH